MLLFDSRKVDLLEGTMQALHHKSRQSCLFQYIITLLLGGRVK